MSTLQARRTCDDLPMCVSLVFGLYHYFSGKVKYKMAICNCFRVTKKNLKKTLEISAHTLS